jgi:hypothetical protein
MAREPLSALSVIHLVLQAGSVFAFPALGLKALRAGGPARLRLATMIALGVVVVFALAAASSPFGNQLVSGYGSADTVPRAVLLYGLTLGLPVLGGAGTIRLLGGRFAALLWPYAAAVIAAGFGWVAGVVLATWLLPLVA